MLKAIAPNHPFKLTPFAEMGVINRPHLAIEDEANTANENTGMTSPEKRSRPLGQFKRC